MSETISTFEAYFGEGEKSCYNTTYAKEIVLTTSNLISIEFPYQNDLLYIKLNLTRGRTIYIFYLDHAYRRGRQEVMKDGDEAFYLKEDRWMQVKYQLLSYWHGKEWDKSNGWRLDPDCLCHLKERYSKEKKNE